MATDRQEEPDFVPVKENVSAEVESAEVQKFLERRGVPTDRGERGKGNFNKGQMRAVESNLPPHAAVTAQEPEDEPEETPEPEEPEVEAAAPPAAPPAPSVISDEEFTRLLSQALESSPDLAAPPRTDPARPFVQRRADNRAKIEGAEKDQQIQTLKGTVDVLLERLGLRGGEPVAPAPAGEEAPPTEPPDFFVDPEAAFAHATKPLTEQIQSLKETVESLQRERFAERIRTAEEGFARENPDYHQVLQAHREKAYNEFLAAGADDAMATELLQQMDQGLLTIAQKTGVPPWVQFYRAAKNALGVTPPAIPATTTPAPAVPAAPKAPAKPSRRDGSIAAARAAVASPSASTLSQGNGLSADAILAQNMTPEDVRRMLNEPGGIRKFTALMKEVDQVPTE